ncbi:MAG: MFS transporter [Deltaproteobacteria bacterium]|nr:MFS transporter [Deltaproteobacteria bacterium]
MSQRFLGIRLAPGVQPINLAAFYVAALVSILIFAFMNQAQILLLTPELGVDPEQKGSISGDLVFWGEVVVLGLVGIFGSLSDKIGRLPIFCGGFVFLGLLCFLQPEAGSLNGLLVMRLFYAVGVAAVIGMLPTVLADYAVDADRGRATGIQGVMNGIGAMITVFALLKLPSLLTSLGDDSQTAVRRTYQLVAYLSFAVAIFLALFLQRRAVNQTQRPEGTLLQIAIEGLRAARDPGIALAYGAAFLSRGLLTVLGVFFTVWGEKFGVAAGYTPVDAVARVGLVIGVAQTFALIGAPLFGILADRLNRVTALVLACAVAALGYGSTWFIHDPLGLDLAALLGVVGAAALIGLGEVGCIITSGVLIAQQAPPRVRGAVIGFFNLSGAAGILVASALGGRLFDNWRPSGPFLLFGALALIVAVWGLAVRGRVVPLREPGAPEAG